MKSIEDLEVDSEEDYIKTESGSTFKFYHGQDCWESVYLNVSGVTLDSFYEVYPEDVVKTIYKEKK